MPLDKVAIDLTSGQAGGLRESAAQPHLDGLRAYLVDRVESGGLEQAVGDITLAAVAAGNTLVIKGVYFAFQAGVNDLAHLGTVGDPILVGIGAGDNAAAANLTTALNNAGVVVIMKAAAPALAYPFATNPGAPSAVVHTVARTGAAAILYGSTGDFSLATNTPAKVVLPAVGRMSRTYEAWSLTIQNNTIAALLNRLDMGLGMTLVNVNTVLLAQAGAELTSAGGSLSAGTLTELLSVLAGRVYRLPVASQKYTAVVAPNTAHAWSATQRGSFTASNVVFDTLMDHGEWRPVTGWIKHGKAVVGGDAVDNEIGGVRTTVDTAHFASSLQTGQLAHYAAGIDLFPDADVQAFVSNWTRRTHRQAALNNQRVVTVYDDDGTLLA